MRSHVAYIAVLDMYLFTLSLKFIVIYKSVLAVRVKLAQNNTSEKKDLFSEF